MAVPGATVSARHNLSQAIGLGQGVQAGQSTTDLVGFYGTTPIVQRSGAAQATSLVGTVSTADVNSDIKAYLIEIGNTLVALGLWKGSA